MDAYFLHILKEVKISKSGFGVSFLKYRFPKSEYFGRRFQNEATIQSTAQTKYHPLKRQKSNGLHIRKAAVKNKRTHRKFGEFPCFYYGVIEIFNPKNADILISRNR